MPICYITFILSFNNSNKLDGDLDDYNSDFKDIPNLEEEVELTLDKDIILLEDNNSPSDSDSEPKEGTSFINIEEYLKELTLIKPLKLAPAQIPILLSDAPTSILKSRGYYNNRTWI